MLVEFCIDSVMIENATIKRREWREYSKDLLNLKLSSIDWNLNINNEIVSYKFQPTKTCKSVIFLILGTIVIQVNLGPWDLGRRSFSSNLQVRRYET